MIVPSTVDARDRGGDHLRPLRCRGVVGLEAEPGLSRLEAAPGELDVGDATGDEVRRDVDVVVDGAANERARVLAGCRMAHCAGGGTEASWCFALWSRPRNAFAHALVPASALSLTTTGLSSIDSSSP